MRKYVLFTLTSILVVIAIGVSACAPSAPTKSESTSQIAELQAQIRQLEAENRELKAENQQLSRDLADIRNLVASPSYADMLTQLTEIDGKSRDLAAFVHGLPDLPPLPPGITVSQIDNAIKTARSLRAILQALRPPPIPVGPWQDLDDMKNEVIDMTYWMEDLEDLPGFLASSGSLEDLKSRIEGYLRDVGNTASNAQSILQDVKNTAS